VGDVKDRVMAKAEGNPLAVGLIAFGAGLLVASLIPVSTKEKEVAANIQDKAQPLMDEVADVAEEVGDHLNEPAQDAVAAVQDAAQGAAQWLKAETQSAADGVKGQAEQAREHVTGSWPAPARQERVAHGGVIRAFSVRAAPSAVHRAPRIWRAL